MKKAILALEDGVWFEGEGFGAEGETFGEVVFNTGMTGYQEILTDPSYKGQIVVMTCPHIGNYGINSEDAESSRVWLEGLVVKELSPIVSNYRSEMTVESYLGKYAVPGIQGIDTRKLVKHLRSAGAKKGVISTRELDPRKLVRMAKESVGIEGVDLVKEVTCKESYDFTGVIPEEFSWGEKCKKKFDLVVVDSGIKFNILRQLNRHGFNVKVVPAQTTADEILAQKPDGVFFSNGPGDPAALGYLVQNAKKLIGKLPIFGICLGHQILGRALGGKTSKLAFGHHGNNHPVMDLATRRIEITSQNHGFVVNIESLPKDEVELTHMNLNDKSLEGFRHKKHPLFCVQYHPENGPGPHDSDYLFNRFYQLISEHAG